MSNYSYGDVFPGLDSHLGKLDLNGLELSISSHASIEMKSSSSRSNIDRSEQDDVDGSDGNNRSERNDKSERINERDSERASERISEINERIDISEGHDRNRTLEFSDLTVGSLKGLCYCLLFFLPASWKEKIFKCFEHLDLAFYFKLLLFSLICIFFIQPLAEKDEKAFPLIAICYIFTLVSGLLFTAKAKPKVLSVLVPIFFLSLAIFISFAFGLNKKQVNILQIILALINSLFLSVVVTIIIEILLKTQHITINELLGAIAAYLIIGYIFGFIYFASEMTSPGQIIIDGESILEHDSVTDYASKKYAPLSPFFYFSFTVITSVGFGDILPYSPWIRALTNLEAIYGMFYLALLVSKLVGKTIE